MHHQTKLIEKIRKGKEIDYLLHERALLSKRIFQDSKKFIQLFEAENISLIEKKFLRLEPPERLECKGEKKRREESERGGQKA